VTTPTKMTANVPLWRPSASRIEQANITAFARRAGTVAGRSFSDYRSLWHWSTDEREAFWRLLWDDAGVIGP